LSLSDGIPRARCIGWGQDAVRLGSTDVNTKPVEEIADGFTFDVAFKRQMRFQRRASLSLPNSATWTPEFGCSVLEILLAERPGVADKVDSEYWFPVKFELLGPGVKLYYQGELADEPEEPGEVRTRPDWCVGSYAVYAADGRKLGHIPRPFAYDSKGAFLWGRWQWDKTGEVLYKAFPVLEMDALKPPLVVDATFGYLSIGGSSTSPSAGNQRADGGFDPGASWNAATIQMYTCCNSGTVGSTAGILSDDGGSPGLAVNVLRDTAEITLTTTPGWFEYTLDSVYGVSNGTLYHFGWDCTSPTKQTYLGLHEPNQADVLLRHSRGNGRFDV